MTSALISTASTGSDLTVRPSASVVILAWNAWPVTKDCLDALRSTVAVGDEVIVVDNGSADETPALLASMPWVKTFTNPDNRGFAGGNNDGAQHASGDILVFLNNDTVPVGRWLDRLLVPFNDPDVVATGPRSNFVSGPQMVDDTDYMSDRLAGLKGFVHRWEAEHNHQWEPLPRLVGFCLAVRRSAFEAVGGFDEAFTIGGYEDDDLCRRLAAHGALLMVHDSFVHHHGHVSFDANGLDWAAIEQRNRQTFLAKHAPEMVAPTVTLAGALVDGRIDPAVDQCLSRRGITVHRTVGQSLLEALDAIAPRPELVVALPDTPGLHQCDVPSVVVGHVDTTTADMIVTPEEVPAAWVDEVLAAVGSAPLFGTQLLKARRCLDVGDLPGAIDAALAAEQLRPGTAPVANVLGICAVIGGAMDDARSLFDLALSVDPNHPHARDNANQLQADR